VTSAGGCELLTGAQVLQDAGRRRQYDAARSASPGGPYAGYSAGHSGGGSGSGGGFQPGADSDDFEEAFRKWWEKAGGKCVPALAPCAAVSVMRSVQACARVQMKSLPHGLVGSWAALVGRMCMSVGDQHFLL